MMDIRKWRVWLMWGFLALILVACGQGSVNDPADDSQTAAEAGGGATEDSAGDQATQIEDEETISPESSTTIDEATTPESGAGEGSRPAQDAGDASEETGDVEVEDGENEFAEGGISAVDDRYQTLRDLTADWRTNWELHSVPYHEIVPAQLRDRIPSIDNPKFVEVEEAAEWLASNEPVMAVELNGIARAYPLQILTWHEIVNDIFDDTPVVVTYCPLCNSALVFEAEVDGMALGFGTSGLLRKSDLIMYDRTTETLWQQFTGDAIVGDLTGTRLTFLPSSLISFEDFRAAFPEGQVLSIDTGFDRPYGLQSYEGYDTGIPFLFGEVVQASDGSPRFDLVKTDDRLETMARVVSIAFEDAALAYPLTILSEVGVINDTQGQRDLAIFHVSGTSSALDSQAISEGRDVGATGVFDPNLNGQKLTFEKQDDLIVDQQTNSTWNILGQAIDGPLSGEQLTPIVHGDHFWFSWAAFFPDTFVFQDGTG